MILVLDTETTGLPKNYKAPISDLENWPRAVEIAWGLYEDDGAVLKMSSFMIKPDGYEIPAEATAKHGITTEQALKLGAPISEVLELFYTDLVDAKCAVAHNFDFDENILAAEFLRAGYDGYPFDQVREKICTMQASTAFCAISGPYGYKWPKLSELYWALFGNEIKGEHHAKVDVESCAACFFELVKRGVIQPESEKPIPIFTTDQKLAMLAGERQAQANAKAELADLLEGLKKSDTWAYRENTARTHAENIERLEAEIKADFVKAFDGKNKKPHPCVTLKESDVTKFVYEPEKAFRFCLTNLTTALSLDAKEFEKQAKSKKLPTEIVTVIEAKEIRAQIASDLSAYLAAPEPEPSIALEKVQS